MPTREGKPRAGTGDDTITYSRIFDHGAAIPLRDAPPDGSPVARLVLFSSACDNPACTCQEMDLLVRPLAPDGEKNVEDEAGDLEAVLDIESGEVSAKVAPEPGSPKAALLARLRRLIQGDLLESLRARWARAKRQDDADEWRKTDWSRVDQTANVPFFEVFPSRWDIVSSGSGLRSTLCVSEQGSGAGPHNPSSASCSGHPSSAGLAGLLWRV